MANKVSEVGDLTKLLKDVKSAFKKNGFKAAAFGIAFTLPPEYNTAHWVTNVERTDGVLLFRTAAEEMVKKSN